ncbi:HD domain-containing protein [Gluconacetobacter diazotrophicus]|uniref:HD domain-containing protein n=1 Tax=Gluconacetobacter diazotrophicus TaxID=33996 RepID=A0A7W4I6W2_GLUDI|nr:HD domain-containing phosphohydrolase [Gluconacetobacter diazotrophicus]MBB2157370.1 HD domain-containing protein [Gluconacetobacter diazotrophicus]
MNTALLIADAPCNLDTFAISDLVRALDAFDPGHGLRVGRITGLLAALAQYQISDADVLLAGRLHDVGKLLLPPDVRDAPRKLTPVEFAIVRQHPSLGLGIVRALGYPLPPDVYDAVWLHHERHDGSGYPLGLAGHEIPPIARIMAIADVIDALLSSRPYKPSWTVARVVTLIRAGAGQSFDPVVVQIALQNVDAIVACRGA